jgi:hypothetical protein
VQGSIADLHVLGWGDGCLRSRQWERHARGRASIGLLSSHFNERHGVGDGGGLWMKFVDGIVDPVFFNEACGATNMDQHVLFNPAPSILWTDLP